MSKLKGLHQKFETNFTKIFFEYKMITDEVSVPCNKCCGNKLSETDLHRKILEFRNNLV